MLKNNNEHTNLVDYLDKQVLLQSEIKFKD